jgi:hypothetical protein
MVEGEIWKRQRKETQRAFNEVTRIIYKTGNHPKILALLIRKTFVWFGQKPKTLCSAYSKYGIAAITRKFV